MIYVRDKGRLCNNILQFGHVYAFSREHGRCAVSMRFAYKYPWFRICRTRGHNPLRYVLAKFAAAAGLMPVVNYSVPGEVSPEKEAKILSARNVMVEGWEVRFYDLFLKYLDEIRSLFSFLPEVEEAVDASMAGSEGTFRIGIHVRRGDYARWHRGRYLFDDDAYARVLTSIASLYPDRKLTVFVCSNDPALNQEVYRRAIPQAEFRFPAGNPAEDLCLLSRCDLLAGAPSTFSLVAAMYRDLPLYWIADPDAPVTPDSFGHFATLFRHIL